MCEAREQRGLVIAAIAKVEQKGKVWQVPSQSGNGKYTVVPDEQSPYCSCPDFENRGECCKHIFAVRCVIKREQHPDGSETVTEELTITSKRKTYPQKWKEYNQAQTNEKDHFQALLRSLCNQIKEPEAKPSRGRPKVPMSDCVFIAAFKVYSTVSQRRFMCDLDDAKDRGYLERTPHYNAIGASLEDEALTPILTKLIIAASLPLKEVETAFAVDSSGFMSNKFERWVDHKYGKVRAEHTWVKAHITTGVNTNVVTAVEIHEKNTNDCPILPSLVATTKENFDIKELSGDKQYASTVNFEAINAAGADAFIPFRSNAVADRVGDIYKKAFAFFMLYREDFLQSYHKRSNVESTFSMIKRKFGDHVRSKTDVAMKNEVLCKILCHNICCLIHAMYELGITPEFSA